MEKFTCVVFGNEARKKLHVGMRVVANAVGCTLGPRGKTVVIQRDGMSPLVTKDGVTVAASVKLREPVARMGAELIREAASQTNEAAGDGTTTATVLTHAMVTEGLKLLEAGYSSLELCNGINSAVKQIDAALEAATKQLVTMEDVAHVGTVSANGDIRIGQLIADAMKRVGRDGIITVEDAKGMNTTLDVVEGMRIDRGYLSPYFVTNNERMSATYDDVLVLLTDKKLSTMSEMVPILEYIARLHKPLLVIADDVDGEALQGLVLNRVKANLQVVAIKAPGYGRHRSELLSDMCSLLGAKLVSSSTGTSMASANQCLGRAKRVIVDSKTSTIVGTGATTSDVEKRLEELRTQLEDVTLGQDECAKLKMRMARLSSGVAVVRVGGATEIEMTERKHRIEDALNATRAAAESGVLPGGGTALLQAAMKLEADTQKRSRDEAAGVSVVLSACRCPLRTIVSNAGASPDVVIERLSSSGDPSLGYNAATNVYEDLLAVGIIDPAMVTRAALKNAASIATTFLALDAAVYDDGEGGSNEDGR